MSHGVCHASSHGVCHGVTHAPVTPVVTVPPTRPDPTRNYNTTDRPSHRSATYVPDRRSQTDDRIQPWALSWRADPAARQVADRHYNRQSIGSPQFVPPGRCLVLTAPGPALWITSWPFAEYVKHAWPGAWINSAFRREGGDVIASAMIRAAVAATRHKWPDVPELGMVTFVKPDEIRSTNPGYCYLMAGFEPDGYTAGGLPAFRMPPQNMPDPLAPLDPPGSLWNQDPTC